MVTLLRFQVLLVGALAAVGCATETQAAPVRDVDHAESTAAPIFTAKSVNVDQRFSDAVDVQDGALVIPTSMLGAIEVGSIVAGDRAQKGATNPYGFLRKVTAIHENGSETTIETEPATLSDWVQAGKIDFGSKRSLFSGRRVSDTGVVTQTLELRSDTPSDGASAEPTATASTQLQHTITVPPDGSIAANAAVSVKAGFDGFFEVQRKELSMLPDPPDGAAFKALLTLDPSVAADMTWTVAKGASGESSWKGTDVIIPIPAPIPITVRYAPELKCNISASGDGSFTVTGNVGAHAVLGFEGTAGLTNIDTSNLSEKPDSTGSFALKSLQGKVTVTTGCELVAVVDVLLFDAAGISGRFGPYANLTATACANANAGGSGAAFTLMEEHGLTETFTARVQIPVLGVGKDFSLWSGKQNFGGPTYLAGDANSCNAPSVDSCAGKTDGFYCSEVVPYAGIVCQSGQILTGIQCTDMSLHCKSGDQDTIACE